MGAHMQVWEEVKKKYGALKPMFAGSRKKDGSWGQNSVFNHPDVREALMAYGGMNGPISQKGTLPFSDARIMAQKFGKQSCSNDQLEWVKTNWNYRKEVNQTIAFSEDDSFAQGADDVVRNLQLHWNNYGLYPSMKPKITMPLR